MFSTSKAAPDRGLKTPVDTYDPPPLERMIRAYLEYMSWDIQLRMLSDIIDAMAEPPYGTTPVFRRASRDDVPGIVRMLADDPLGARREAFASPLPESYYVAFEAIDRDANNELIVAELDGRIIGVLQMTFIPYLTYRGGWRALIEGVRIDSAVRSSGLGQKLFAWAIDRARQRSCHLIQLTSDKARPDAIRFYESLGFVSSHEGFKLHLDQPTAQAQ